MGEWSDFFEDFPEYNPANSNDHRVFFPSGVQIHYESDDDENTSDILTEEEIEVREAAFLAEQVEREAEREVEREQENRRHQQLYANGCIYCGSRSLSIYNLSNGFYLCQCKSCNSAYKKNISELTD